MVNLETKYLRRIVWLKKVKGGRFNSLLICRTRKQLKDRLKQLEYDYDKGLITNRAYVIWKNMINEVL